MSYPIKQSSTQAPLLFMMVLSSDHISPATGLVSGVSLTVTIRKPGGSFASPAGTVTEIANGWYQVAGNATDSNTLGPLLLHATGTGADPTDLPVAMIVAYDPQSATNLGLSAVPTASPGAANGIMIAGSNAATTVNITGSITGSLSGSVGSVTGAVGSVTGSVGSVTGAVGSVTGNVGGNVTGTVASVVGNVGGNVVGTIGGYASGQDPATLVLGATATSWNTSGTIGNKINSAASAGDPWTTAVPGSYGAGTAGFILGALTGTGIRGYLGLASANLDTQLGGIDDKTTNLPADPAGVSDIPTAAQNADKLLGRSLAGGSDGTMPVKEALYALRCEWSINQTTGVWTVKDPAGSTSWSRTLSTDPAAEPVIGAT